MYNPELLQIRGLMSVDSQDINLHQQTSIIYGENLFDQGQNNNGAGKSAILEAIVIAKTGRPLRRDTTTTDLIRRGKDSMHIYYKLRNSRTKDILEISRTFYRKTTKSQEVSIKFNTNEVEITDANHANAKILEYLGIEKDDLLNYYLISKDKYQSFFSAGDAKKKEIISRFSKIELIDGIFSEIATKNLDVETKVRAEESIIATERGKLEVYNIDLEKEKSRNIKNEKQTAKLGYEQNIFQSQTNLDQTNKSIKAVQDQISQITTTLATTDARLEEGERVIAKLDKVINGANTILSNIQQEKNAISEKQTEAQALLNHKVNCPSCDFEFSTANTEKDLTQVKSAIPILTDLMNNKVVEYNNQQLQANTSLTKRSEAVRLKETINRKRRELATSKTQLEQKQKTLETLAANHSNYIQVQQGLIKEIDDKVIETREKELNGLIDTVNRSIKSSQEKIDNLNIELEKNLSLKNQFINFKTYLVNKTVKVIEFHCNRLLEKMGSALTVNIEGYRPRRGGKGIVEKITTTVYRNGVPEGGFGAFSSGERSRIEVVGMLALQSLINSASSSGGLNLLFLDEIVESVDSLGITGIVEELDKAFNKCIFIVTHATYDGNYDKVLKVTKHPTSNSTIEYVNVRE